MGLSCQAYSCIQFLTAELPQYVILVEKRAEQPPEEGQTTPDAAALRPEAAGMAVADTSTLESDMMSISTANSRIHVRVKAMSQ